MAGTIKLSTFMQLMNDLNMSVPNSKKPKESLLSKTLKGDELLKELKGIRAGIGSLPHLQHSSGGSDCG